MILPNQTKLRRTIGPAERRSFLVAQDVVWKQFFPL